MGTVGRPVWRLAGLAGIVGAGLLLARVTGLWDVLRDPVARLHALDALRDDARIWWVGPLFSLVYAIAVGFGLPASALTLVGGAAFGFWRGILWVSIGANLGSWLAFFMARRLGRTALEGLLGARIGSFDRKIDAAGFEGLLILRLLPVVPFNLLNFAAGLTPITSREYATATLVGILPGTVVYVLFADALLSGSAAASREALLRAFVAGAVLVAFSLVTRWLLGRKPASSPS